MNVKLAITYILILMLSLLLTGGFAHKYYEQKQTSTRLLQNIESAEQELVYYKTEQGNWAAKNDVLEFTTRELQSSNLKLVQEVEKLSVKPNRVSTVSKTATSTNYTVETIIQDTILADSIQAKTFYFHNDWLSVRGMAEGDTQTLAIHSIDTILQVVYRGKRKKPYLWILSPRKLEQVITSQNPNTTIVYNQTIQITK